MTHLILHKVRGQPAFDIAEQIQIGDEEGWIIPTSGHRAYPYQSWLLEDILDGNVGKEFYSIQIIPDDWPDHYQDEKVPEAQALNLLDFIKIPPPKIKLIRRRV